MSISGTTIQRFTSVPPLYWWRLVLVAKFFSPFVDFQSVPVGVQKVNGPASELTLISGAFTDDFDLLFLKLRFCPIQITRAYFEGLMDLGILELMGLAQFYQHKDIASGSQKNHLSGAMSFLHSQDILIKARTSLQVRGR
jgi:hypothetical protein